jgi:hypothetical protein
MLYLASRRVPGGFAFTVVISNTSRGSQPAALHLTALKMQAE